MARNRFENELEELNISLVRMGGLIEQALKDSVKALITQDKDLCEKGIAAEKEISARAAMIESAALKILLRQQPVASDLRKISTALKMVTDMERIGAQASDICEIVVHLCGEEFPKKIILIPRMADLAVKMANGCIDSFVKMDIELAQNVMDMDNEMDELFAKVKDNMIKLIKETPAYADQAIYLMMIAKYFEKIGDHAENIAGWVVFCKTGEHKHIKIL